MSTHIRTIILTTLVLLTALGCGSDTGQGSATGAETLGPGANSSPPPEPHADPVTRPSPAKTPPEGLVEQSSSEETLEDAGTGASRLDAENFAISFAQMVVDIREERDQEAVIDDLTSARLPSEVRDFLLWDYMTQRDIGTQRRLVPDLPAFIRSSFEGAEQAPSRVNVELAAALRGLGTTSLSTLRVDVVHEDDRWQVIDFGGPSASGSFVESPEDVRANLEGGGWRPLPS